MHNTKIGILHFDPDIDKIERTLGKAARLARERTKQQEIILIPDYSADESEMGKERRVTL